MNTPKAERLKLLTLMIVVGFGASVFVHYWRAGYQGLPYPDTTWLYNPSDRFDDFPGGTTRHFFGDFYTTWAHSHEACPYRPTKIAVPSNYFPFTHLFFMPLAALDYDRALTIFLLLTIVGVAAFVFRTMGVTDRLDNVKNVFVLTALTYPMQMVLDRGNIEGVLFLLLALFMACLERNKLGASVMFLSCAAAMKLYPALFALLYLARREYRAFASCCVLTGILTLASLATFEGGMVSNAHALIDALRACDVHTASGTHVVQHGSSFYGMLRTIGFLARPDDEPIVWFDRLNLAFTLGSLALLFAAHLKCRLQLWQSCTLITFVIILVPKVSFDYKLVLLYLPLALLMNSEQTRRTALLYTAAFGLLMSPKGFWLVRNDVSIDCIASPALMLAIAGSIVATAYAPRRSHVSEALPSGVCPVAGS